MNSTQDLILWQKMEDFVNWYFPIIDRYPKHEKFSLCSQIKNLCYDILKTIVKTNKSRDRRVGWYEIDISLEMLRWFLRHSYVRKYLSHQSYETATKK